MTQIVIWLLIIGFALLYFLNRYDIKCLKAENKSLKVKIEDLSNNRYEIAGVIADVEHGNGFDNICLQTLKRVEVSLINKEGPTFKLL